MAKQDRALPCCKDLFEHRQEQKWASRGEVKMYTLQARIYTANFFDNVFRGKYNHEKQMFISDIPSTSHALIPSGIFFREVTKVDSTSFFYDCQKKMRICTAEFALVFCLWSSANVSTTWPGYKPRIWVLKIYACHIYFLTRIFFFMILRVVFVLRASLTANYNSSN